VISLFPNLIIPDEGREVKQAFKRNKEYDEEINYKNWGAINIIC